MPVSWTLPGEDPARALGQPQPQPTPTPSGPPPEPTPTPAPARRGAIVWNLQGEDPAAAPPPAPESPGMLEPLKAVGSYALGALANPFQAGAEIAKDPRQAGALAARMAPGMVGQTLAGPVGGFAGGALGELIAQVIEGRDLSPAEMLIGGAGSAIGFPRALTAGRALAPTLAIRGAEGAVFSAADEAARMAVRGEELEPNRIMGAGMVGGPLGAAVGGGIELAGRSPTLRSVLEAGRLAREPEPPPAAAAAASPQGAQFPLAGQGHGLIIDNVGFGMPPPEMRPAPQGVQPMTVPMAGGPEPTLYGPPGAAQAPPPPAAPPKAPPVQQAPPPAAEAPVARVPRAVEQGAASPEAQARLQGEASSGVTYERVNVRTGQRRPEPPTVDRADLGAVKLNPNEVVIRRAPGQPVDIFAAADNLNRQQLEQLRAREQARPVQVSRETSPAATVDAVNEIPLELPPAAPQGWRSGAVMQHPRAVELKNGQVFVVPKAGNHAMLIDQAGLNVDDVRSTGFMVEGKYQRQDSPLPGPDALLPDRNVGVMPLTDIHEDAARFQTRVKGTTRRLEDVAPEAINDLSLGNLGVWRDPENGLVYIVEGHHRRRMLNNAGRTEARVQFIDAANATEARLEGALMNMRAGTFDALDVAGVLRDTGLTPKDLEARGVELTRTQMRDGLALANLHPALWGMAMRDELPLSRLAVIGRELGQGPEAQAQQLALVETLGRRRGTLSDAEVAEVIRQARQAPTTTETQTGLFGEEEMTRSLMVERAQVVQGIREQLLRDRRLFGYVTQGARAARLGEEGTQVDVGRAQQVATESAQVGELFDRLANRQGRVAEAVNAAARAAATGQPIAEVVRDALPEIRAAVAAELAPTAGGTSLAGQAGEGTAGARPDLPEGEQGLEPDLFKALRGERGAIDLPNPRNLLRRGRAFAAELAAEQAEIAERRLAQRLEAARRRGTPRMPGTAKAPLNLEERVHGRAMPQDAGALSSDRPNRLAPSIGEAFGDEVDELLNEIGLNQRTDVEFARRGVVTDREMTARADEQAAEFIARADADPTAIAAMRQRAEAPNAEKMTAILNVNRHYATDFLERMNKAGDDPVELLRAIRSGLVAEAALKSGLPAAHATLGALRSVDAMLQAAGGAAELGRGLRAIGVFKRAQPTDPRAEALRVAAKIFNTNPATARERLLEFQTRASQLRPDDIIALNHLIASIDGPRMSDKVFRYVLNGWLSGPKGILIDALSNGVMLMRRPLETALAAPAERLVAWREGRKPEALGGEAVANLAGMYLGLPTAVRRFMRTMVTQLPEEGAQRFYEPGKRGVPPPPTSMLGRLGNLPSTTRMAIDEAFKSLNESSVLYGNAYQIPWKEGLRGADHVRAMADIIRHPERVHGLLEEMTKEADFRTWQDSNDFTNTLLTAKAKLPGLRYVIPFVRTPLALFRQGMRDFLQPVNTTRNALGTFLKATGHGGAVQERWLGELPKGRELAEQLTRTTVGMLLTAAILHYALEGKITGAGPFSAERRRELRATGWAPNSIMGKDSAVSYNRLDPVGLFVGTIADMSEAIKIVQLEEEDAAWKLGALFARSVGNNFVNKTYMRGLADTLEAIRDPERYLPSWFQHEVASLVPFSTATAQLARATDPTIRQGRTLKDVLQTRIPGLTKNVFPLRDVFGRDIIIPGGFAERMFSPFDRSRIQNDPATRELRRLEYAPGTPLRNLDVNRVGVDLTPEQYDRYVVESGKIAYKMVSEIIASQGYKDLAKNAAGDDMRRKLIQRAFTRARMIGRAKTLPHIKDRVTAELELERALLGMDVQGPADEDEPAAAVNE